MLARTIARLDFADAFVKSPPLYVGAVLDAADQKNMVTLKNSATPIGLLVRNALTGVDPMQWTRICGYAAWGRVAGLETHEQLSVCQDANVTPTDGLVRPFGNGGPAGLGSGRMSFGDLPAA